MFCLSWTPKLVTKNDSGPVLILGTILDKFLHVSPCFYMSKLGNCNEWGGERGLQNITNKDCQFKQGNKLKSETQKDRQTGGGIDRQRQR